MKLIKVVAALSIAMTFSHSAQAKEPLSKEAASASFSKPYLEFGKDWMTESGMTKSFGFLGGLVGAAPMNFDSRFRIARTFDYPAANAPDKAIDTFTAYCEFNRGNVKRFKSEVFCLKNDAAFAQMFWQFSDRPNSIITYHLHGVEDASQRYKLLITMQPGDTILVYGNYKALIIDKKDNNMVQIQSEKTGLTGWITTDNISSFNF